MHALRERAPALVAALWWGSLSVIGFVAVPLLFAHLPSPTMAGYMAARLFEAQTYISIACCAFLFLFSRQKYAENMEPWAQAAIVFVIAGLLLALLLQYGAAPRIIARQNLALWHGVGSVMYGLQWLCALAVFWRTLKR